MLTRVLIFTLAASLFAFSAIAEPASRSLPLNHEYGAKGLADISSLAVFSADSQYLFVALKRQIQVFRCRDGQLVNSVQLPGPFVNPKPRPIRRLVLGLEGNHFCGRVLQAQQDVRYSDKYKPSVSMSLSTGDDPFFNEGSAEHYCKVQFHHPGYLKVIHDGTKLLAGIAQQEAYLLEVDDLIAGEEVKVETLFRFDPNTELSSFAAALQERQYVFLREHVQLPEMVRVNSSRHSEPAEQTIAGTLEVFDAKAKKFVAESSVQLENPFPRKHRRKFQVFTLLDSRSAGQTLRGIQIGCTTAKVPESDSRTPCRRFKVSWDSEGKGTVNYEQAFELNAQPHIVSPDLRFYVSTVNESYLREIARPRLGVLRQNDTPTDTKRYDAVAGHYWINDTLHGSFSPDGTICAINDTRMGSFNPIKPTKVAILESASRRQLALLETGDGTSAYVIAMSPDNRFAFTITRGNVAFDKQAMLWDLQQVQ